MTQAPLALTCPRCSKPANPAPGVQTCGACGGTFALHAGPAYDGSVKAPPPDPSAKPVKVKAAGVFIQEMGIVEAYGVATGVLDPVTGMIPLDKNGVGFHEMVTVAVWRRIAVQPIIAGFLLALPFALLCVWGAVAASPMFLVVGLPFDLAFAWAIYRAFVLEANMMRIVGTGRAITIRFDSPIWRRVRFHDEVLRRAGIAPSAIP